MQFVTEAWHPLDSLHVRPDDLTTADMGSPFKDYEVRHWMALMGFVLFLLAPLAWALSGMWVSATLLGSLALLLVSIATLLVPESSAALDAYQSSQD
jgi:hypothetical protein